MCLWYALYKKAHFIHRTVHTVSIISSPSCETWVLSYRHYITEANLSNSEKIHSSSQLRTEWAPSPSKSAPWLLSDKTVFFSVSERPPGTLSFLCLEGPKPRMSLLVQNSRGFSGLHKRSFCYKTFKTEFLISYSAHQSLCFFIF